jgi:hypothetical protein
LSVSGFDDPLVVTLTSPVRTVSAVKTGSDENTAWTLTEIVGGVRGRRYDLSAHNVEVENSGGGDQLVFLLESDGPAARPASYRLHPNHPNPFNPITVIGYDLPAAGRVELTVYTVLGERVATLVDGFEEAGVKSVEFRADGLPSGVYFYRLKAGNFTQAKKMLLAR